MKIFVPDTNLLLHGKFITDIEWGSILEDPDLRIFISSTVLKEVDKTKYSNNIKRRKRARKLVSVVETFIGSDSKSSIAVSNLKFTNL